LEKIKLARLQGFHRNLLVSATGTGKTVMAALDYASLIQDNNMPSLLFVAHRKEILSQALATFRHALRDPTFGELWVGGQLPTTFQHVFASIQTLNKTTLDNIADDRYTIVIVDEFHHAAAKSYQNLLNHFKPKELLGLTATPERSDGLSILSEFHGRIAAELRLWDAIDQQRLTPFAYFGISDNTDLTKVRWQRGKGYDVEGLTKVLTADDANARIVLAKLIEHVNDINAIHALGFCVSVAHAQFMARIFNKSGVPSLAVWADTPPTERMQALQSLSNGETKVLFSVDLFNEGVDIPSVDTLLMLRPTQSGTLFLQQLGRGLRQHNDKNLCTVLDFIGQHRNEFRFDQRFKALIGGTRKSLRKQIEQGFPFLPAGCHMSMDRVAASVVLNSIKQALPSTWKAKASELASMPTETPTLAEFLAETGLDLDDVYSNNRSWSDLQEQAGKQVLVSGKHERPLRKAIGRLLHVDDENRIDQWAQWLTNPTIVEVESLPEIQKRTMRMLVGSMLDNVCEKKDNLATGWNILKSHPQVCQEITELLAVLRSRITHIQAFFSDRPNVPLKIHARYTRLEMLAASGVGQGATIRPWREGALHAKNERMDIFAFTLDKSNGGFSPTTRYRDYAISRKLIHWESQNSTREASDTGMRYKDHKSIEHEILLFARNRSDNRAFWFLGPADYISHEGERPMAITWRLEHPLPGDMYVEFAAAVA